MQSLKICFPLSSQFPIGHPINLVENVITVSIEIKKGENL